jgi:hypothetical protein
MFTAQDTTAVALPTVRALKKDVTGLCGSGKPSACGERHSWKRRTCTTGRFK